MKAKNIRSKKKNIKNNITANSKIKNLLLISVGVFLIILLLGIGIGFSYAFWFTTKTQTNVNEISTGCLSIKLNDVDLEGNVTNINLLNTYPLSDDNGLLLDPYTFTITNTCSLTANVNVYLHNSAESTILSSYIKFSLDESIPDFISNLQSVVVNDDVNLNVIEKLGSVKESYILDTLKLAADESITYNLRMWIDYDAPNELMGQSYKSAISVLADSNV